MLQDLIVWSFEGCETLQDDHPTYRVLENPSGGFAAASGCFLRGAQRGLAGAALFGSCGGLLPAKQPQDTLPETSPLESQELPASQTARR